MKLTKEQIAKMSEDYKKRSCQHVAERSVTKNGILASAEDGDVIKRMSPPNFAFTIDVDDQAVANQKMSGRCWMFACLNVLRFHIEKDLDLPKGTFELSQAHLAFYNKLERAAWFMEHIVATADKPLDDREVDWLISTPMADGGDWDMIAALVKKYGVMPHQGMAETHCTNDTAELNTVLSHLLRQDAIKLRQMANEKKDTTATQLEMLNDVYRILCVCFGEPPEKFDFTYTDNKGKYHEDRDITPLEFAKKYVKIDLDDYVGVINVPGEENPYGHVYAIQDSDQIPERRNLYVNVPMDELKGYVIESLKAGDPVWFGSDVLQWCDRMAGVMSEDLYDLQAMFDVKFDMDKAQRFAMHESLPTHAMTIAGVDIKDGKPDKWKIENSWGVENHGLKTGNNGYFVATDKWFDNFVYEVAIPKKMLKPETLKALDSEPIVWSFWNTFNPVSHLS